MMVGSTCPWGTALGFFPMTGIQCRFGWGTLLAGALLVLPEMRPAWLGRQLGWVLRHGRAITQATSGLALLLCLFVTVSFNLSGPLVSADWGLYLTLVAALAVVWSSVRNAL